MGFKLAQTQATPTKPPLKDRIEALRAEIDAVIDEMAAKDAGCGIPLQSLRDMLTRGSSCQCRSYLIATGALT
jgi:hypothetical protein